ncbi:MAG TPA: HD domain-containing protein [Dehalococcoidia bacterium]|jgi:putative nucleotidyltransferase with HDIG domain|nr:HD domain-containing protein [Dehalococcoidia bacterium]
MDRAAAWDLLCEYTKTDALRKHALAVEAIMRHFARKEGEDEERWGIVGLLHDFDYERWPTAEGHPFEGNRILKERGYPEDVCEAIMGHAEYTGVPRRTKMAKVLYAVDELSGLVTATALVRPNKSIFEVEPASVRKKMKDRAFARSVNREDIVRGAEELGMPLDDLIAEVIEALKGVAGEIGLQGTA